MRSDATLSATTRHMPIGAEILPYGGVSFRVWAPDIQRVRVVFPTGELPPFDLTAEPDSGYHSGTCTEASEGIRYLFLLDGKGPYPDPASRFQPEGTHGPSEVIDPTSFDWTDGHWSGPDLEGQVLYEMHIGTFTREGTFAAAEVELPELARLGITAIELMPVAAFSGPFGWGYDGVDLYAPTHLYGRPDDLRRFIDRAHGLGIAVLLDVVYNHLGPDGNNLPAFSKKYFSQKYTTDWGEAINYDGPDAEPVREFVRENAAYWIREYRFDGLRVDATQDIHDASPRHILAEITQAVRRAASGRRTLVIAENEPQQSYLVDPEEQGGYGMDAVWNDDFHHSAVVATTGHNEAYYSDYRGTPQEFISSAKYGYLYQGQWYRWQRQRRGTSSLDQSPAAFVNYLQNHDQVANLGLGKRLHLLTSPGRYRAITAVLLLFPGTPMLFQGQEFASSAPFAFFADPSEHLRDVIRKGRKDFVAQFRSTATPEILSRIAVPSDPEVFQHCKLDFMEREKHASVYRLHRDLIQLRRSDPAFSAQRRHGFDGAVLGPEAFVIRYFMDDGLDRLLVVNLGLDLALNPAPEPLLGPPTGSSWQTLWSSEQLDYDGRGTPELDTDDNWQIPGHCAVVLKPVSAEAPKRGAAIPANPKRDSASPMGLKEVPS